MSSVGLNYDTPTYEQKLHTSIGPGMYMLGTPANDGSQCAQDVPFDPYLRWQNWGPGFCAAGSTIDVDSDLHGITRKASKCAADQYHPSKSTVHQGCVAAGKVGVECARPTEPTRLSNPPCNMRESGNNRWEWLCWDPQDHALEQFERNVSYRIVAKDNHVPCLPTLIPQDNAWPQPQAEPAPAKYSPPQPFLGANSGVAPGGQNVWQSCHAIGAM
jgi:hypothetical protein